MSVIYDPVEEYESKIKALHLQHTKEYLEKLVQTARVDPEENRVTLIQYEQYRESTKKLKSKLNWFRFLRVLMCITLVLIPVVIWKMTPVIRQLREEVAHADEKAQELMDRAHAQMAPLNRLFTDEDALRIAEQTVPLLDFAPCFTAEQEEDMKRNYDFCPRSDEEQSAVEVLAGRYNGNPFLFEKKRIHQMGVETYHGYRTIYWTEHYRDSQGHLRTRTRSQTLHATVTKPKPFYSTQTALYYGAQGGPELSFSRDATHLDRKSEKAIERYVKKGEKKLKKKADKALKENDDFVSMSNSEFEVLFDALDRTDEVQFRTLFTPLAQTNMVGLLLSPVGYGDDFDFVKRNRMNKIVTAHSQQRALMPTSGHYVSHSFDEIKEKFISENTAFFKAVYFDFAPLWSIPIYQERPVHSLMPLPEMKRVYTEKEYEVLANRSGSGNLVHPSTKTQAIFKTELVGADGEMDQVRITAHSYDTVQRTDVVPMLGGDGRIHSVPVQWDEYIPLEYYSNVFVADAAKAENRNIMARKNNLCLFY